MEKQMNFSSLYDAFSAGAGLNPDAPALLYKGKTILYRDFQKRVDRLALVLTQYGIKAGDVVSAGLPNMPKVAYLIYAANKIGAVIYLQHALNSPSETIKNCQKTGAKIHFALDTAVPRLLAEDIVRDAGFQVFSCCPADELGSFIRSIYRHRERLKSPKREPDILYDYNDFINDSLLKHVTKTTCPTYKWNTEKTAVLLDSGGTTGIPKTVELSAKAINKLGALGSWILERDALEYRYMMSPLPVFHCFGLTMGLHAMVMHGGCNVFMPKFSRKDAIKYLKKGKIDYMIGVPAVYDALLSMDEFHGRILQKVDTVFVGGDDLLPKTKKDFDARMEKAGAKARLFQGWGLSETLSVACVNTHFQHKDGSIGKPLKNVRVETVMTNAAKAYLLNQDFGDTLPKDATVGELCVCGEILFNGYYQDEQATAATFFTDQSGTRWLATGDLGYIDSDGFVFFLDRMKNIIKVFGESIFPARIESLALCVKGVKAAAAFAVPDARAGSRVRIAVEPDEGVNWETLRGELEKLFLSQLHKNAVPIGIDIYHELPKTKMLKTDIKKLIQDASIQGVPSSN